MRARRASIDSRVLHRNGNEIIGRLVRADDYANVRRIALYRACGGEVPLDDLAAHARSQGKRTFLPRVVSRTEMAFIETRDDTELRESRWGIPEPVGGESIAPDTLDWVLVPVVAFDSRRNRLGAGGGYYDRTFAFRRAAPTPRLIGVAHDCQQVDNLDPAPWDVPMDVIVTEKQWME